MSQVGSRVSFYLHHEIANARASATAFEPKPELLGGKVALIADPTGAAIGILEWPEGLEKGGQKP